MLSIEHRPLPERCQRLQHLPQKQLLLNRVRTHRRWHPQTGTQTCSHRLH